MLKYTEARVVFREIPEEITLAINISGCPVHCPECHSKYLWEDIGTELEYNEIYKLIKDNEGITAICFMGGDAHPEEVGLLARYVKYLYKDAIKVGWYSGKEDMPSVFDGFDYVKIGHYDSKHGPIDKTGSNQKLYFNDSGKWIDITYKIQNEY